MITYPDFSSYEDKAASAARSLTGGNIVSIGLRSATRLKAQLSRNKFTQKQQQAQNISKSIGESVQNPKGRILDIPITIITQEVYNYEAQATQYPVESGAIISDHVILKPLTVDISFEVSNWEFGDATWALELLQNQWASRSPCDLLTYHTLIDRMVMVNLNVVNSLPHWGKITCRAKFQQIGTGVLQTVDFNKSDVTPVPDKTNGPDASQSATPSNNPKVVEKNTTYLKQAIRSITDTYTKLESYVDGLYGKK
jgi:hypothetical protein